MKKFLENKWVQLILYIIVAAIMAMIVFPLLDYIWALINKNTFVYSFNNHIRDPIIFGVLLGIFSHLMHLGSKNKK